MALKYQKNDFLMRILSHQVKTSKHSLSYKTTMGIFNFTESDKEKTMANLLPAFKIENFGITELIFNNCEKVHDSYWEDSNLSDEMVASFGFKNVDDFKYNYIICQLYIRYSCRPESTLLEYLTWHILKGSLYYKNIPDIPEQGDIVEYFMQYDIRTLLSNGW